MQKFIKKLIERLEEEKQRLRKLRNNTVTLTDYEVCAIEEGAFNFCQKAVNELAEEYNNCSTDTSTNQSDTSTISKMENVGWVIDGKGIHKQTNADRIRSMTDEELAEFLDNMCLVKADFHCEECNNPLNCDVCYLDWLQSEAE